MIPQDQNLKDEIGSLSWLDIKNIYIGDFDVTYKWDRVAYGMQWLHIT